MVQAKYNPVLGLLPHRNNNFVCLVRHAINVLHVINCLSDFGGVVIIWAASATDLNALLAQDLSLSCNSLELPFHQLKPTEM